MKRCSVGGQAVLEGVMMKTPEGGVALAVRRSDGSIVREFRHMRTKAVKGSFYGLPIVRGVVSFVESLVGGMRITTRSAEIYCRKSSGNPQWMLRSALRSCLRRCSRSACSCFFRRLSRS